MTLSFSESVFNACINVYTGLVLRDSFLKACEHFPESHKDSICGEEFMVNSDKSFT